MQIKFTTVPNMNLYLCNNRRRNDCCRKGNNIKKAINMRTNEKFLKCDLLFYSLKSTFIKIIKYWLTLNLWPLNVFTGVNICCLFLNIFTGDHRNLGMLYLQPKVWFINQISFLNHEDWSLCIQTLINPYIFPTRCRRPLIFQTTNSVRSNSLYLRNIKVLHHHIAKI